MNKPTGAFILSLAGGSLSMVGLTYPVLSLYSSIPDTMSVGLVIVIISIFLREMPERNITLGAVIAAISIAQLASSLIVIIQEEGLYNGYNLIIPFLPLAGSIISLLGGLAAILWKP